MKIKLYLTYRLKQKIVQDVKLPDKSLYSNFKCPLVLKMNELNVREYG